MMNAERPERVSSAFRFPLSAWYSLLLVLVVLAVFGETLSFEFLTWDDDLHVTANPRLRPLRWSSVLDFWRVPHEKLYIPLSYGLFATEVALSQALHGVDATLDASLFHAVSVLLHAINSVLAFVWLRRLVREPTAALLGALLFALHPLQIESVAWISEQRGLLSTLLVLLCLLVYRPESGSRSWLAYSVATVCFVLAMLAKPSAVVAPVLFLLIGHVWAGYPLKRIVRPLLPWFTVALSLALFNKSLQGEHEMLTVTPLWQRPLVALDALSWYLRKLLWPTSLSFDAGRTPALIFDSGEVYWTWLLAIAAGAFLVWKLPRKIVCSTGGWFLITLLPVLGLVSFVYQDISTVADRYTYLPLLGVAWGLSAWLAASASRARYLSVCGVIVLFAALGVAQSLSAWHDSEALYQHALDVNPRSFTSYHSLANLRHREGRLNEAEQLYDQALAIHRDHVPTLVNRGVMLAKSGQVDEAEKLLRRAIEVAPRYALAHLELGNLLVSTDPEGALACYGRATELDPVNVAALVGRATLLLDRHAFDEVRQLLDRAGGLKFRMAALLLVEARLQMAQQQLDAARATLEQTLAIDPGQAVAHEWLGSIHWQQQRLSAALGEYDAALRIDPLRVEAVFNRGGVLIALGRVDEGLAQFSRALRLVPRESPLADHIRREIAKYQQP